MFDIMLAIAVLWLLANLFTRKEPARLRGEFRSPDIAHALRKKNRRIQ